MVATASTSLAVARRSSAAGTPVQPGTASGQTLVWNHPVEWVPTDVWSIDTGTQVGTFDSRINVWADGGRTAQLDIISIGSREVAFLRLGEDFVTPMVLEFDGSGNDRGLHIYGTAVGKASSVRFGRDDNIMYLRNTQAANDDTSGALQVAGGVGVQDRVYVGEGFYCENLFRNSQIGNYTAVGTMPPNSGNDQMSSWEWRVGLNNTTSNTRRGGLQIAIRNFGDNDANSGFGSVAARLYTAPVGNGNQAAQKAYGLSVETHGIGTTVGGDAICAEMRARGKVGSGDTSVGIQVSATSAQRNLGIKMDDGGLTITQVATSVTGTISHNHVKTIAEDSGITLTLPATTDLTDGQMIIISNMSHRNSSGNITVARNGTQTIAGLTSVVVAPGVVPLILTFDASAEEWV